MRRLDVPNWMISAAVLATAAAGCGKSAPQLAPVRGVLLLDGKPMQEVVITFAPTGQTPGSGSIGATDREGKFELSDVRGGKGARPGDYKVHLYPAPKAADANSAASVAKISNSTVPKIYIDPNSTPVQANVPAEGVDVEIKLTTDGRNISVTPRPLGDADAK